MPGGVEELFTVDDVSAKFLGSPNRDRLHLGDAGELMAAGGQLLEACLNRLEGGAEGADAHVPQLRLESGVLRIGGEGTGEGLGRGGHLVAPIVAEDASVSTVSVSASSAA